MISKLHNKKENTKGFTLVETIVVLVIIAIMMAVSVGGIIAWRHNAEFRKANEYAKTLFTAAQTYLSGEKASGNLKELQAQVPDTNTVEPEICGSEDVKYLLWTPSDYQNKRDDNTELEDNTQANTFYEMFRSYLYDKSILDASICVEFNPSDGVVSSVLYSTHADKFSYNDSNNKSDYIGDLDSRETDSRKEVLLGLYNTEIGNSSPSATDAPKLGLVSLVNGDTLDLTFQLKGSYQIADVAFDINILDADDKKAFSFSLDPANGEQILQIPKSENANIDKQVITTTVYGADDQPLNGTVDNSKYQMRAYVTNQGVVTITLDAVDLKAASILNNVLDGKMEFNTSEFQNTYSILRFGKDFGTLFALDSTKEGNTNYKQLGLIRAEVQARGIKTGNKKTSNQESPLIQVSSGILSNKKYNVANARHLFNLRFMEYGFETKGYNRKNDDNESGYPDIEYHLTKDFSWSDKDGILDSGKVFNEGKLVACNTTHTPDGTLGYTIYNSEKFYDTNASETDQEELSNAFSDILQNCSFPALPSLAENHTLNGENKTISGFYVVPEKDKIEKLGEKDVAEPLGLLSQNLGTIKNITLKNMHTIGTWTTGGSADSLPTGIDYVGGLCGKNSGEVNNVEVKKGKITGHKYVGGVIGKDTRADSETTADQGESQKTDGIVVPIQISKLKNSADVWGFEYVGGILSSVDNNSETIMVTVSDCTNTGSVRAQKNNAINGEKQTAEKLEPRCIGGVIGYNNGADVKACTSAPALNIDISKVQSDEEIQKYLIGNCVGGIIGYQLKGNVSECTTTGGTIIGDRYIGGIIGFNGAETSTLINGSETTKNEKGINQANVIGNSYVGGIVGANAEIVKKEGDSKGFSNKYNENYVIENWTNKGLVVARKSYGGGITGYNTGKIQNCNSMIDVSTTKGDDTQLDQLVKWSGGISTAADGKVDATRAQGNFLGGLVGYNNGKIVSDTKENIVSVVAGDSYIGGIVGYNDEEGDIDNYNLLSGYLSGNIYVGGFAGVNVSENLFTSNVTGETYYAVASPNTIRGNYFVGGMVGANFMVMTEDVTIACDTDNFLGKIQNRDAGLGIYMGGLIGYNVNLNPSVNNSDESEAETPLRTFADKIVNTIKQNNTNNDTSSNDIATLTNIINREVDNLSTSDKKLTIEGQKLDFEASPDRKNELNRMTGLVYVGGTMGYNQSDSILELNNIVNQIPVTATGSISDVEKKYDIENKTNPSNTQKTFSYAGGIIGIATRNTTITSCKNDGLGSVTAEGTYHGALVEVNEGTIQKCDTGSTGQAGVSYVGGIAGVNGYSVVSKAEDSSETVKSGEIKECNVTGTIRGNDYVGGVAAENYGIISQISFNAQSKIEGVGENIGGVVGNNIKLYVKSSNTTDSNTSNSLLVEPSVSDVTLDNLVISGKGTYVGGVVGSDSGVITDIKTSENVLVKIEGNDYVGGIIGRLYANNDTNDTRKVSGYINRGTVSALAGSAAGIIGVIQDSSKYEIDDCTNYGNVSSKNARNIESTDTSVGSESNQLGNASGIVEINTADGTINNCYNYGEITASQGNVGGITTLNEGVIRKSSVKGLTEKWLTLKSQKDAGGIACTNYGEITDCELQYLNITNLTTSGIGNVGGVVGTNSVKQTQEPENTDKQDLIQVGIYRTSVSDVNVSAYKSDSCVGGVAGLNESTIDGENDLLSTRTMVKNAIIRIAIDELNGNLGGIVGVNKGSIIAYDYCVPDNSTAIKGFEGSNNGYGGIVGINDVSASIDKCAVEATIEVVGSVGSITNIGGIAGINRLNGIVQNCDIKDNSKILASNAYIGGAVGRNYGSVSEINSENLHANDDDGKSYDDEITANNNDIKKTNAAVLVYTKTGQIGGIIGQNEESGSLSNSATGLKWFVNASATATDNATGGAIGYNYSSNSMVNIKNLGCVVKTVGNSVAGLVGRWEISDGSSLRMVNCENYGRVKGLGRVGGMIGQWKYSSGTLNSCVNYGTIIVTGGDLGAAGLVGCLFEIESKAKVNLVNCINYGKIKYAGNSSIYLAGLMGRSGDAKSDYADYVFTNCVNAGDIEYSGTNVTAGGISATKNQHSATYYFCRNYGRGGTSSFKGIASNSATMHDCYGIATKTLDGSQGFTALAGSSGQRDDNYYFAEHTETDSAIIEAEATTKKNIDAGKGSGTGNYQGKQGIEKIYDETSAAETTDNQENRWYYTGEAIKNDPVTITIYVNPSNSTINNLYIDWYKNLTTEKRVYYYQVQFFDMQGKSLYTVNKVTECDGTKNTTFCETETILVGCKEVNKIVITINRVQRNNTEANVVSIWEVRIDDKLNHTQDGVKSAGTPLYMYKNEQNSYIASNEKSAKKIENLPYDPNGEDHQGDSHIAKNDYKTLDPLLVITPGDKTERLDTPTEVSTKIDFDTDSTTKLKVNWRKYDGTGYDKVSVKTKVNVTVQDSAGNKQDDTSFHSTTICEAENDNCNISIPEKWIDKGYTAIVTVQHVAEEGSTYLDSYVYYCESILLDREASLPSPEFYLKLKSVATTNRGTQYHVVWDNVSDSGYEIGTKLYLYYGKYSGVDIANNYFVVLEKNSDESYKETFNNISVGEQDGRVTAIVKYNNAKSKELSYWTDLLNSNTLKNTTQKAATGSGTLYYGTTPDSTYSKTTINSNYENFYRTELVAYDESLETNVSIASSIGRTPSKTNSVFTLSDLPDDYNYDTVDNVVIKNLTTNGTISTKAIVDDHMDDNADSWNGTTNEVISDKNPGTIELLYHDVHDLNSVKIVWGDDNSYIIQLGYRNISGDTNWICNEDGTNKSYESQNGETLITDLSYQKISDLVINIISVKDVTTNGSPSQIKVKEIVLDNLSNIGKKKFIEVRSYMWTSQNAVVHFTWYASDQIYTADDLKNTDYFERDGENKLIRDNDGNYAIKDGYSIEKVGDNQYKVLYSRQFINDDDDSMACQVLSGVTGKPEKGKTGAISVISPAVINPIANIQENNITFQWDTEQATVNNQKYEVILKGYITKGGAETVLFHEKDIATKFLKIEETKDWKYRYLDLTVIKYGLVNSGETTQLGSKSEQGYDLKLPLSTIMAPKITLSEDKGDGKDELRYYINWTGLTDQEEIAALDKYEIYARKADGSSIMLTPLTAYDAQKGCKVDFDSFDSGEQLQIYVNAIAKESSMYSNSADGIAINFTVPVRLDKPNVSDLTLTMSDGETTRRDITSGELKTVTAADFNNGFMLKVGTNSVVNQTCVFQAYIYPNANDTSLQENQPIEVSQDESGNITYNSQILTPYQDAYGESTISMGGNAYILNNNIGTDYAGSYLIIRTRVTSDNQISSKWSDYCAFQLPKVQLDTPNMQLMDGQTTVKWDVSTTVNGQAPSVSEKEEKQDTLRWDSVNNAQSYEINLQKLSEGSVVDDSTNGAVSERYKINILKDDSERGYSVKGQDEDYLGTRVDQNDNYLYQGDSNVVNAYIYTFVDTKSTTQAFTDESGNETPVPVPGYQFLYSKDVNEGQVTHFEYTAILKLLILNYNDGTTQFRLILPDGAGEGYTFQRTQYVTVQAKVAEDATSCYYGDSLYMQWIRVQQIYGANQTDSATREMQPNSNDDLNYWNTTMDGLNYDRSVWGIEKQQKDIYTADTTIVTYGESIVDGFQDSSISVDTADNLQESTTTSENNPDFSTQEDFSNDQSVENVEQPSADEAGTALEADTSDSNVSEGEVGVQNDFE